MKKCKQSKVESKSWRKKPVKFNLNWKKTKKILAIKIPVLFIFLFTARYSSKSLNFNKREKMSALNLILILLSSIVLINSNPVNIKHKPMEGKILDYYVNL